MTQHYELVYLVRVDTSSEDVKKLESQVSTYIETHGELLKSGEIGKRPLAYEIDHQSHALYWLFDFRAETESIKELHRTLTLNEHVIRFLIVATPEKTQEQIEKEEQMKESAERARMKQKQEEQEKVREEKKKEKEELTAQEPTKEKEHLSLEELDKKLDELLDDDSLKA